LKGTFSNSGETRPGETIFDDRGDAAWDTQMSENFLTIGPYKGRAFGAHGATFCSGTVVDEDEGASLTKFLVQSGFLDLFVRRF